MESYNPHRYSDEPDDSQPQRQENLCNQTTNKRMQVFQCPFPGCGKIFRYKSEKERHYIRHSSERPYICSVPSCNKSFETSDALKAHSQIHNEKIQFNCPLQGCPAVFNIKSDLEDHIRKHLPPQQISVKGLLENSQACFSNPSFGLYLQHLYLQAKGDLLRNTKEMQNLYNHAQQTKQSEIYTATAKRFMSEGLVSQPKKMMCTENDKICAYSNLSTTTEISCEKEEPQNDELSAAELLLKKLEQDNQELRKRLANQMNSMKKIA